MISNKEVIRGSPSPSRGRRDLVGRILSCQVQSWSSSPHKHLFSRHSRSMEYGVIGHCLSLVDQLEKIRKIARRDFKGYIDQRFLISSPNIRPHPWSSLHHVVHFFQMLNYSVFSVFLWYFIDFYIDKTCIVAHRSKSTNRHEERSKSSPFPTPLSGGGPITARDVERESVKSLAPAWTQSYISTCLFWHLPSDLWKAP